jgi:hypothetical protein
LSETCGPSLAEKGSDKLPETSGIDPRWAPLLAMHDQLKSMNASDDPTHDDASVDSSDDESP